MYKKASFHFEDAFLYLSDFVNQLHRNCICLVLEKVLKDPPQE